MSILAGVDIFSVKDKVVLITGAGAGLGAGYAEVFGELGSNVVCADINLEAAKETVKIINDNGGKAVAVAVDVTSLSSINEMVSNIVEIHGRIDVLINNAGVEYIQPFQEVSVENYDKISNVNIKGVFFTAQAVSKQMAKQGGGKIINIGSLGSFIGLAESSVYCSTKGAITQLTKTMALELADKNIQVNFVAPGYFITPMTQGFYDDDEHRNWIESRIPLGRWGTKKDLAGAIVFLASEASDYVSGTGIIVDGGWLAS